MPSSAGQRIQVQLKVQSIEWIHAGIVLRGQGFACTQACRAHDLASAGAHPTLVLRLSFGHWLGGLAIATRHARVKPLLLLFAVGYQTAVAAGG